MFFLFTGASLINASVSLLLSKTQGLGHPHAQNICQGSTRASSRVRFVPRRISHCDLCGPLLVLITWRKELQGRTKLCHRAERIQKFASRRLVQIRSRSKLLSMHIVDFLPTFSDLFENCWSMTVSRKESQPSIYNRGSVFRALSNLWKQKL